MKKFWRTGEPCVWFTGAALSLTLLIAATLVAVVLVNGLGVFWPSRVALLELHDGNRLLGEVTRHEERPGGAGERMQLKIGNRDLYGLDFRWVNADEVARKSYPDEIVVLERTEHGNFYGYLRAVQAPGLDIALQLTPLEAFRLAHAQVEARQKDIAALGARLAGLNSQLERLRLQLLKLEYRGRGAEDAAVLDIKRRRSVLKDDFEQLVARQGQMLADLRQVRAAFEDAGGRSKEIALAEVVRLYQPNAMTAPAKAWFYLGKLKELIFAEPREANTEGGLYPAIFGTVILVFLMTLVTFPMGVIAAVYLREYAKDGILVRIVRIAVNNLAGIPSIVYGIFGLGFFVYGVGGAIDQLFFPERLPTPTFGTGGILWASLTLALLTVPVVIVATDEALGAIPGGVREGSLALGSTKFQTLMRILLPMASPGIMTGLILAMARAAGEVAPLMITGVVKLAPALPLDGTFPFFHLDRKFMHLGFHIYDIGFQSPNVEAAKPMVFVTTLLLVLIVLAMSSVAIRLRNKMKKRYTYSTF